MYKNPLINALGAFTYIALIVSVMNFITRTLGGKPDSAFAPILFLSLLCVSVSIMACLFFYQPLLLIIDGKKKEAFTLFVQTVGIFGAMTGAILILLLSGVL